MIVNYTPHLNWGTEQHCLLHANLHDVLVAEQAMSLVGWRQAPLDQKNKVELNFTGKKILETKS